MGKKSNWEILVERLKYELRDIQKESLEWCESQFLTDKKFLFLELPVGSGKSVLSQYIISSYWKNINPDAKIDLVTNSKVLQEQYLSEFKYLKNLWGKNNYECSNWNNSCDYGKVCNKNKKTKCEHCPFDEATEKWIGSKIGLTNFHILGLSSLFNPGMMESRNGDVLIVDESHLLEETINGFVSFTLSPKTWQNLIVHNLDRRYEETLATIDTIDALANWIERTLLVDLMESDAEHRKELSTLKNKKLEEKIVILRKIEELLSKLSNFLQDHNSKISEWIGDKKIIKGEVQWIIQPLWTGDILKNYLWSRYKLVILMSGTILNPDTFAHLNGIDTEQYASFSQPSPFPKENRPIYFYPQGKLNYQSKHESWPNFIPAIKQILNKYKGQKGIIHTNSYEFLEYLQRDLGKEKRLVYVGVNERIDKLLEHSNRTDDSVLVSPSMTEGIDLKDDLSRFQIILKVPYPSLGSKVNKTRLKQNYEWYSMKTVQTIIQSYGRSIRNENDYCDTFILDSCFEDLLRYSKHVFPKYVMDAVNKIVSK